MHGIGQIMTDNVCVSAVRPSVRLSVRLVYRQTTTRHAV